MLRHGPALEAEVGLGVQLGPVALGGVHALARVHRLALLAQLADVAHDAGRRGVARGP